MELTEANITSITDNNDNYSVTVAYTDQDNANYTAQLPWANAPDQTDVTASDNYDYYTSLILGS